MRTLLLALNAKYIHSNIAVRYLQKYAAPFLRQPPQILELTINNRLDFILDEIFRRSPDILLFSTYIWNVDMVRRLASEYRKLRPDALIGAGGPEVSYESEAFLRQNPAFGLIIRGEGEQTVRQLLSAAESGADWHVLPGLTVRTEHSVRVNPPQPALDLSGLPFPYEPDFCDAPEQIKYYESSRGCPFQCQYCLSSIEKGVRAAPLDKVFADLKVFLRARVRQVKFVDRTFNYDSRRALEIWRFLRDHDNGVTNFHFEIAADIMTKEEIELISTMRQGLIQLEIGVQSVNLDTLSAINRKTAIQKIADVTKKIKSYGNIHQHLDLIAGLPYEDYESFKHSFNVVYAMKPDQLQLGFLKVLHGSEMEMRASEFGIVYSDKPPYEVLKTKWIGFDEILKLKAVESVVEIYYNSFQFSNTIKYLESCFESAFDMFFELGMFYNEKSSNGEKHSRVARYEILLEFINKYRKNTGKKLGMWTDELSFSQLLTLDFYLRENAKNRPPFSQDNSKYKNIIKDFYKSEMAREKLPGYEDYDSRQLERMTHMEVFSLCGKNIYVLFDYENRNALSKEAKLQIIDL